MQNKRIHRIFLAILFMLSFPLMVYSQWLPFQSQYLIKHTNGEDEIYSLYQVGNKKIGEKEYEYFIDFKNNEFFCRIEDDKLIRFDESDEKEYVICDYNLKEGDIFDTRDGRKMKVIQVGDSLLDSFKDYPCYCINLMNIDDPFDTDLWVKFTNSDYVYYMGSYNNLFMFPEELDDFSEHHLLWNNYGFVNILNTENVKTQMMKVERKDDYLSFDEETGEIFYPSDSLHCEFVKDTLVVSGRVFTNCSYKHYLVCHVQGQQIFLEVMAIPPSAACESSHYFTAKFPGFKPGEYTFELNSGRVPPSGITEITGDLVCKEYTDPKIVEDGKIWDTRSFNYRYNVYYGNDKRKSLTYELSGDTIIGITPCVKMYAYEKYNFTGKQYLASLYEQEGKVFFFPVESDKSYLMYDFSLSKGDVVKVFKGPEYMKKWSPVEATLEVANQDEVDMNGMIRKRLYMKCIDSQMVEDTGSPVYGEWIEGIGTMASPVWNADFVPYDQGSRLERCQVADYILYEATEPDYYNMLDANTIWLSDYATDGIRQTGGNALRLFFTKLEMPIVQLGIGYNDSWRMIYACENGMNEHVVAALSERRVDNGDGQDFERKVYIKPYEDSETSYLLYDFTADVGDEIEVAVFSFDDNYSAPHELKTRKCRVDYVEDKLVEATILYNSFPRELKAGEQRKENVRETITEGHHLKHLYLTVADENGSYVNGTTVCWIEGVGSVYGLDGNVGTKMKEGFYPESLLVDCSWEGEPFYKFEGIWSDIVNIIDQPKTQIEHTSIYDISGRRLNTIPERGIYIQNGKKVIK